MEDNTEGVSPLTNGVGSGTNSSSASGSAQSAVNGDITTKDSSTNGTAGTAATSTPSATVAGPAAASSPSQPQVNGASPTSTANAVPTANGSNVTTQQAANSTVNSKTFAGKRSRLGGLPPPMYSPLGAASPMLTSNASAFPAASNGASSGSTTPASSVPSTPLASAQADHMFSERPHHAALPPQQQQQQQQQHQHSQPNHNQYSAPQHTQHVPQPMHQQNGGYGQNAAPSPVPSSHNASNGSSAYPALHLHPLNDTFIPKQISLYPPGGHNRIKIGRQTNAKTVPAPTNGYFDSKVLSRMHAEVWCEGNKVYIKDVKSSNGTFINGERLSPEAVESDVFELHNNDMVEFGIDITSEDAKTIVHHKVAARIFLVMNADDAVAASRSFANYYRDMGENSMHRRGGMGNKNASNMNLDQVLNRLQTELQKSRDTGAELGSLTNTIGEIHETLGGNLPGPPIPAYRVPAFNPHGTPDDGMMQHGQQQHAAQQGNNQALSQMQSQMLSQLQSQLQETQNALNGYVERIKNLEQLLGEQERMKSELKEVKERMEDAHGELERLKLREQTSEDDDASSDKDDLDDLDGDSIKSPKDENAPTISGHALDNSAAHDQSVHVEALTAMQIRMEDEKTAFAQRMETLSGDLSAASLLSKSLQSQHVEAAATIRGLEGKVHALEEALHTQQTRVQAGDSAMPSPGSRDAHQQTGGPQEAPPVVMSAIMKEVESRFFDWKRSFEDAVQKERQDWDAEREKLHITLQEWERRSSIMLHTPQQAPTSRKKRRSKASTVSSSSGEGTSASDRSSDEAGFVSPVTDDSGGALPQDGSVQVPDYPKRPRSRRRKRSPLTNIVEAGSTSRAEGDSLPLDSEADVPGNTGRPLVRKTSWIPFGSTLSDIPKSADSEKDRRAGLPSVSKSTATMLEHPALPILSAAGIVVIGYLAYTTVLQNQK